MVSFLLTCNLDYAKICNQRRDIELKDFKFSKKTYSFLMENMIFSEPKKEKEIFELWYKGYNNIQIGNEVNFSEATIRNRKRDLIKRANQLI